tara:strand:+ start:61 stop:597 length:537 start_codon:yes stop_codon:yes gene_type:complete
MGNSLKDILQKESASERLSRRRREEKAAKKAAKRKRGDMKGVKLDRERNNGSKKIKPKTMTATERGAAGRTKQSRRDLKPSVYPPFTSYSPLRKYRSSPFYNDPDSHLGPATKDDVDEWEKQLAYNRKWGVGSDKLHGGLKMPAISKTRSAFTEVERPPKTRLKKGGRLRMDGTAKPR